MLQASGRFWLVVAGLFSVLAACGGEQQVVSPGEDADAESGRDAGADPADAPPAEETGESDAIAGGAPLTFLSSEILLTDDRACDLDDDGLLDNSMADLRLPSSTLFIAGLNAMISAEMPRTRFMYHLPWVEDLRGPDDPDAVFIFFEGRDTDDPEYLDDDFSGSEPFFVCGWSVDGCGEPLHLGTGVRIEDGQFTGSAATFDLGFANSLSRTSMLLREVTFIGAIERGGGGMSLTICAGAYIHDLGTQPGFQPTSDLSLLEGFLYGGQLLGLPTIPGLTPDLDHDGDGLERILLDDEGHIASCVDGDNTLFEGRDCWTMEEMADGFSLVWHVETVGAIRAGLEPDWQTNADGTCDEPPEQSLWNP